jgi:hypothetical protein
VVRERYAQSVVAGLVWDLVTDGPAEQNGPAPRMERV